MQLNYLLPGCVTSIFKFTFINWSMLVLSGENRTREVALYCGFKGVVVRPHTVF